MTEMVSHVYLKVRCYDHCQPHIKLSRRLSGDLKSVEGRLVVCERHNSIIDKVCSLLEVSSEGVDSMYLCDYPCDVLGVTEIKKTM